jgi:hypothetical protein
VPVARDEADAPQRATEDILRLPGLGPHRAALVGEEIRPLEPFQRVREEREDLAGPEDLRLVVRDRARADLLGRVLAEPLARLLRPVERADEVLAEVVDGPRREVVVLLLEEELDVAAQEVLESFEANGAAVRCFWTV